jgi:hypothetical protein
MPMNKPQPTLEMQLKGLEWLQVDNRWRIVCSTCKGNCGQCGLTDIIGNEVPASLDALAKNLQGST